MGYFSGTVELDMTKRPAADSAKRLRNKRFIWPGFARCVGVSGHAKTTRHGNSWSGMAVIGCGIQGRDLGSTDYIYYMNSGTHLGKIWIFQRIDESGQTLFGPCRQLLRSYYTNYQEALQDDASLREVGFHDWYKLARGGGKRRAHLLPRLWSCLPNYYDGEPVVTWEILELSLLAAAE